MEDNVLDIDIAIIGGGSAGLWLLNRVRRAGYGAALFDHAALGSGQSIHSQGIVHGGLKYALSGVAGQDAAALAEMPGVWRDCLAGRGSVDLSGCRIISEHVLLWSGGDLPSRLASMLAGKLLRGRTAKLARRDYPAPFDSPDFSGQLYQMEDFVVDTASLLERLARPCRDAMFNIDWARDRLQVSGGQAAITLPGVTLRPRRLLLCAGAGNAGLLQQLGARSRGAQCRTLSSGSGRVSASRVSPSDRRARMAARTASSSVIAIRTGPRAASSASRTSPNRSGRAVATTTCPCWWRQGTSPWRRQRSGPNSSTSSRSSRGPVTSTRQTPLCRARPEARTLSLTSPSDRRMLPRGGLASFPCRFSAWSRLSASSAPIEIRISPIRCSGKGERTSKTSDPAGRPNGDARWDGLRTSGSLRNASVICGPIAGSA